MFNFQWRIISTHLAIVQSKGGGIGVTLTQILSEIKMIMWSRKFSTKLEKLQIVNHLLERFVDNISVLPEVIPIGCKYNKEKDELEFGENIVEENLMPQKM